ncbi:RHS repeat domain-containing protein [Rapidithrix thailandica]|uniref:RHS repeat domain-containing protein n=1 Tax=Rapidithrix thailandica TaxID=413964 RepID=UPI003217E7A3
MLSASDYFPFGKQMAGRNYSDENYRYGFNGKEGDGSFNKEGDDFTHYDFGARIYDGRIGRWLSRDPLEVKYPMLSTYCFVGNSPIMVIDPNGKEIILVNYENWSEKQKEAWETFLRTPSGKELYEKYNNSKVHDIYFVQSKYKLQTYSSRTKQRSINAGGITLRDISNDKSKIDVGGRYFNIDESWFFGNDEIEFDDIQYIKDNKTNLSKKRGVLQF